MKLTRALGLAIVAAACAVLVAAAFRGTIADWSGGIVRQVADVFQGTEPTGRRVYGSKDDIGRSEESQITGMMDSVVALATGASTSNFQEVRALAPTMSLSRLSRSVGMLIFTERTTGGGTQSYSCTGFMISPRFLMTAAHCFFADPDSRTWSKPSKLTDLDFVPNFVEPGSLGTAVHLKLKTQTIGKETVFWRELACPGNACSLKGAEKDGHDFAVLELTDESVTKARAAGVSEAILGDVALGPQQQLVIFQHPGGGQMMFVERHCLTVGNIDAEKPTRDFFKHFCDTLDGSSGAPVFSRDHEVVVGLHVQGSRPFTAAERTSQSRANGAIHVSQIATISSIISEKVPVALDPPTSEQNILINAANLRGEEAQRLLNDGRGTLAGYVALGELERPASRADAPFLLAHIHKAQDALASTLSRRLELMTLDQSGQVISAAFSPDGSRIVTGGDLDNIARVWDAKSGAPLLTLKGHEKTVTSASFSPDGSRILTAAEDDTTRIWDARSGSEILILKGHNGRVESAEFSRDGTRIVTASGDKSACIWNAKTGSQLRFLDGHEDGVESAAFSPDGSRIVTGSQDNTARVWDVKSGATLLVLKGHKDWVTSAAFSPDGTRIVTGSSDNTARVWDAKSGALLLTLRGNESVNSAAFSPDGTRIVTASDDDTARVWDAKSGVQLLVLKGHEDDVQSAVFSPDGSRIVTGSDDNTARLWDAKSEASLLTLKGHEDGVTSVAFAFDGSRIVTAGSWDRTARVWDAKTGAQLITLKGHRQRVDSAAFSPDGSRIVTGSWDFSARVWDAKTGAQLLALEDSGQVLSAAFSPDGLRIVTGSDDARVWDAKSGAQLLTLKGHEFSVTSAAFSPDGSRIVTGSRDNTARVWDVKSGATLFMLKGHDDEVMLKAHADEVTSAAFSPDGTRIVTGSSDNTARVWDAKSGALLLTLRGNESMNMATFSPDGLRIVTVADSADNTARVWDAKSGAPLLTLKGHEDRVTSASFSSDGSRIVTGSRDNTARVWRVWPSGPKLIDEAYCRLRLVKPSDAECGTYDIDCKRDRTPPKACDPASVSSK